MNNESTATILVVEDEPFVRLIAVEMIEQAGWNALEAGNSAEALAMLADVGPVDVLFTDINMPGEMDGLALARQVHRSHPRTELVITSGKQALSNKSLPDDGTFLCKPYGVADLIALIESKLCKKER